MTLKLGIIGAGNIFRAQHIQAWLQHPEVEVVAVCDINANRAKLAADDYNIPHAYQSHKTLLENEHLDIIDICAPNSVHAELAIDSLMAGKHVFCEKPDAITVDQAIAMSTASEQSGKLLMTMRNNRFRPTSQWLKRYIQEGNMGEIYTGRCGWVRRRGIPGKGGWFTTKALSGGGPLIDLGVHYIDLAMWLMGNPTPISVTGATYQKFAKNELSDSIHSQFGEKKSNGTFDVEDLATGFIRFDNGATLQIEFSWASNIGEEMSFLELRGTNAGCAMKRGELEVFTEVSGQLTNMKPVVPKITSAHHENIKHFVDCVFGRSEPTICPQDGIEMIKILNAIYLSANTGYEIRLSDMN